MMELSISRATKPPLIQRERETWSLIQSKTSIKRALDPEVARTGRHDSIPGYNSRVNHARNCWFVWFTQPCSERVSSNLWSMSFWAGSKDYRGNQSFRWEAAHLRANLLSLSLSAEAVAIFSRGLISIIVPRGRISNPSHPIIPLSSSSKHPPMMDGKANMSESVPHFGTVLQKTPLLGTSKEKGRKDKLSGQWEVRN